jgi:hypothetical protein
MRALKQISPNSAGESQITQRGKAAAELVKSMKNFIAACEQFG